MNWEKKYGPWALVTGASSGLGAEFVRQLAFRNLNIVLAARRKDRMNALVSEITNVQTRIISIDLTKDNACCQLVAKTKDLEIGLLVNNAGYGMSGDYHTLNADRQANMTVLNCVVPVLLTSAYLQPMVERGKGGLIFIASTAAYQPCATLATYGATKAFNLMLGEALSREYLNRGIDSFALSPGFTRTEFHRVANIKKKSLLREASPGAVVATCLRNLGKRPSVVHGLFNKILTFTVRLLPRKIVGTIAHAILCFGKNSS